MINIDEIDDYWWVKGKGRGISNPIKKNIHGVIK